MTKDVQQLVQKIVDAGKVTGLELIKKGQETGEKLSEKLIRLAQKTRDSKKIRDVIESKLDIIAMSLVNDLTVAEVAEILEKKLEKTGRIEDSITVKKIKVS